MRSAILMTDKPSRDIALVANAIKKRWPIKAANARELVDRLLDITRKTEVTVATKDGVATVEAPADVNAIAAARVLVAMVGQNEKAAEGPRAGPTINVGVQVDARSDDRRDRILQIAERVRASRISVEPSAG